MVPGRGRLRAAALTTLLVLPAVSGCSGSGTPEAEPGTASSGSSPSVAASPSQSVDVTPAAEPSAPSVPPAPEPPQGRTGPAGQEAFARFVMDAWAWSLRTNDATPLLDASLSRKAGCDGCSSLAKELRGRAKEGWYVDFPGLDVGRTKLRRNGDTVVATSAVSIPESNSYTDDGSYRSTSPAHEDATFTVTMRVTRSGCRLVSFRVG
jgi:hypothetical protein